MPLSPVPPSNTSLTRTGATSRPTGTPGGRSPTILVAVVLTALAFAVVWVAR